MESIDYCGARGFSPVYFTSIERAAQMGQVYVEAALKAGNPVPLGQNQTVVRWLEIGETEEAAREQLLRYDGDIFKNFHAAMGRRQLTHPDDIVQSIIDSGLWIVGTVEQVRDKLIEQWKQLPAEYIVLIFHYAQMPKDVVIRHMETFMRDIKPALDELSATAGVK
jgi:alkanesulfonate monooxygenase SsuD/methylene tetrahydromethanopterin reductase-like flavin-dependent oxidoreductase (luciferase family)